MTQTHRQMQPSAPPASGAGAAVAQIISDERQWEGLREPWNRLHALSPTAAPPLHYDWLRTWWDVYGAAYGRRGGGLRIVAIWREGRLVGALPLYLAMRRGAGWGARRLGFISTGEAEFEETCPDYMDLLHAPGEEQACLEAVAGVLRDGHRMRWDRLELSDISERSPLLRLAEMLSGVGRVRRIARGVCPMADISGGLETYLARLSANTRQQARRLLRAATAAGVAQQIAATSQETDAFFDELVALHQARWRSVGQPGCFAAPRFVQFHRSVARQWVPAGRAVMARLATAEDRPLSVIYGFMAGDAFHFYQSGNTVDDQAIKSPGTVAFLRLMEHLAEHRGVRIFDFLRGASGYKQRLATHEQPLFELRIVRPTIRSGVAAVSDLAWRAARKGGRMLTSRPKASASFDA